MFRIAFPFFAFIASVSFLNAEPLPSADVKSLLARIREKRAAAPQLSADFQEEKTIRLLNKPVVSSGKVWFQAPNKFRREAKGNAPSVTVSNGKQLSIYYPKFQSAELYTLGKRSPLDTSIAALTAGLNLERVEDFYNVAATKTEHGYVLELTPKSSAMRKFLQKFVIQLNENLQGERTEMQQPNGDRVVTIYRNESRAPIDPALFDFTPPAGTNISTPMGR